ncbi:FMRFamide peptide receptor frpr-18-like [Littorina saxatilis]
MVEVSKNVQMVIRYIIVVFAIPLTICNVVVFLQKSMRSSTSIYVVFLSFAQLIFIVCNIIVNIVSELVANPFTKIEFCMYYIYVSIYVGIVAKRGSYVVMCLLSLERLYAVVKPLHIKEFFLSKFPVLCICLAYALSALWHLYIPLRTTVEEAFHPVIGVYCKFQRTELYLKTTAVNDFFSLSAKIVLSYGALFGQMVLNLLTIWALKRHNVKSNMVKSTASDDSKKQRERQLTVTILAATISYVTLSFLSVLLSILSTVYPTFYEAGKHRNIYSILIDLSFNLNILSMAIDFLCFFSMSANYRKTLLQMLPCKTCCAARNAKAVVVETEQKTEFSDTQTR